MSARLCHRPKSTTSIAAGPSSTSSSREEPSLSSSVQKAPRKRTSAGDRLPENERPFIKPVGKEWEVHPFLNSRRVAPVLGALLKLFYPDLVGPKGKKRVAKRWEDYKWSKDEETPSAASIVKREFWLRFRCAPGVNLQEVDQVLNENMKNLVRQMLCEIKREAFEKVY